MVSGSLGNNLCRLIRKKLGAINFSELYSSNFKSGLSPQFMQYGLRFIAFTLIFLSGYFLTYDLFLRGINTNKLVNQEQSQAEKVVFKYAGVAYFQGVKLFDRGSWDQGFYLPWVANISGANLEMFIQIPSSDNSNKHFGTLVVTQEPSKITQSYKIDERLQQRIDLGWHFTAKSFNKIQVSYVAASGNENSSLNVSLRVVNPQLYKFSIVLFIAAVFSLFISESVLTSSKSNTDRIRITWLIALVLVAFVFHSGGLITQELFTAEQNRVVSSLYRQLGVLLNTGHFSDTYYRGAGAVLLPFMSYLLEGGGKDVLSKDFTNIYPTIRYLHFSLFLLGVIFLSWAIWKIEKRSVAIVFSILAISFFPFVVDLYSPDSDALFIILFPFFCTFLIRFVHGIGSTKLNFTVLLLVFFLMATIKVTALFLVIAAPLTLILNPYNSARSQVFRALFLGISLLISYSLGSFVSNSLQSETRNVGIQGERFQESVIWHMIWAAAGTYDQQGAHDFAKSAHLRNQRVSEVTKLPQTTYLRHSQRATDELYRPGIFTAFRESPGYFISTTSQRFYEHGLKFYRYTYAGDNYPFDKKWIYSNRLDENVWGRTNNDISLEQSSIRFDTAWKLSSTLLLAKLTQIDISRLADVFLIILALVGLKLSKNRGLAIFFIICFLTQIGFGSLIHGVNRYFMFCSFALIYGLAIFISYGYEALKLTSRVSNNTIIIK